IHILSGSPGNRDIISRHRGLDNQRYGTKVLDKKKIVVRPQEKRLVPDAVSYRLIDGRILVNIGQHPIRTLETVVEGAPMRFTALLTGGIVMNIHAHPSVCAGVVSLVRLVGEPYRHRDRVNLV